jgi:4-hydroxybenzoate polyprenyltransferase
VTGPAGPVGWRDLLRLYRVSDWLHFLPLPLAGWLAGEERRAPVLAGALASWALALAYASAINQAFDGRLDRRAGKNPVGSRLGRRAAVLLSLPPALAAMLASAALAPAGLAPTLLVLAAATLYSAPPRLKRVPVLGTLWNVVIALPGLVTAGLPGAERFPLRLLAALFALLLLVSQLLHEADDRDDDRAGGVATVAVVLGVPGALWAACAGLAALPLATYGLAAALALRGPLTAAAGLFSAGWLWALGARLAGGGAAGLRGVRLRYRYTALALGAAAFLAAARGA